MDAENRQTSLTHDTGSSVPERTAGGTAPRVTRRRLVRAAAAAATVVAATAYTSPEIRSFKIVKTASAFSF
ncbi:MAG: hypothetical protein IT305_23530 [Chloroflexi bacterium]|nr:hypothetical protein [Chloroflexota bacterium]